MTPMPNHNKMTILPLHHCDWSLTAALRVADDLALESVEGILRPENFDLWHDYVAKKERDDLSSVKAGIIHRFSSKEHIGRTEVDSQELIYKTFLLLRLIRPTRERYSNIQVDFPSGTANVFGFAQPTSFPNTPNTQTFNLFHREHFLELSRLLPKFLHFAGSASRNLIRAVRMFESGYSEIGDPLLQFVTWTIGVESFFSEDQHPVQDFDLFRGVSERLGAETDIYSEAEFDLFPYRPDPVKVASVLPDVIELRNRVIHGIGAHPRFDDRNVTSPATGETIHYVDVLRETASFILRKLILQEIEGVDA
jgi:hypothetical protein